LTKLGPEVVPDETSPFAYRLATPFGAIATRGCCGWRQEVPVDPQDAALASQLERLHDNIERIATLLERSLDEQELENEVTAQRGRIRDWQDHIDEELTSRR